MFGIISYQVSWGASNRPHIITSIEAQDKISRIVYPYQRGLALSKLQDSGVIKHSFFMQIHWYVWTPSFKFQLPIKTKFLHAIQFLHTSCFRYFLHDHSSFPCRTALDWYNLISISLESKLYRTSTSKNDKIWKEGAFIVMCFGQTIRKRHLFAGDKQLNTENQLRLKSRILENQPLNKVMTKRHLNDNTRHCEN